MKADSCAEITDAKQVEMKSGLSEPGEHRQYGFVIPAGVLIGIGAGLLAGQLVSGFLIGLGLGLIGSELLPLIRKSQESECTQPHGANATTLLTGAFLAFIGTGIVLMPAALWPYAIAGFFILAGLWFLVRGFSRR